MKNNITWTTGEAAARFSDYHIFVPFSCEDGALIKMKELCLVDDVSLRHLIVAQPRDVAQCLARSRHFQSRRQLANQITFSKEVDQDQIQSIK